MVNSSSVNSQEHVFNKKLETQNMICDTAFQKKRIIIFNLGPPFVVVVVVGSRMKFSWKYILFVQNLAVSVVYNFPGAQKWSSGSEAYYKRKNSFIFSIIYGECFYLNV